MTILTTTNNNSPGATLPFFRKDPYVSFGREAGIIYNQSVNAENHFTLPYSTQTDLHKFCILAATWKEETRLVSIVLKKAINPSYQQIIGMGMNVVPFILEDLIIEGGYWFWALKAITGVDPVKNTDRGNISKMTDEWLDWGRKNGYIV